ncbi:metalloprotease (Cop-G1L) [Choristoneura rosaceana entomopoxvirus 'L']|uniref:Metalloprotease (Cop-G1L) n=1 Tax=Choristoneura rosaceana entomopoxvirus 'L' TaxID=1293539 RepID=A0ABM9QKU5_9POXV|nr:metalloprotease (Cop-G1L) [Choristoneura rosaceana entomopoxvirus 'L']CCU56160.1 metalloprotease (Cop-G1L) [Choristoneura rosaceana entomopoxvirus 'L']
MNIKILNNGMRIIYGKFNNDFLINIGINNFGQNLSIFYKQYKLIHFIEHILVSLLIKYTGKYALWNGYTNTNNMNIYYDNIIDIPYNKIITAIINLFNDDGIYIDNKIINDEYLKNENIILNNEKRFRLLTDMYEINPILYLLTNDVYLEGNKKKFNIDVKYINEILKTIEPKNIIFYTSNIDFFNILYPRLNKIKFNRINNTYIDRYLSLPIYKSNFDNSIYVFSFDNNNRKYSITVKFNLSKYAIIGYLIDKYYYNKLSIINLFSDKIISISTYFLTSDAMYKSLSYNQTNEIISFDELPEIENLNFDDYIILNEYFDIISIHNDIKNKNINKYSLQYNKYIDYIKNSSLDINKFYLHIPNELYLNNEFDINNIPVFKSETLFSNKIDLNYNNISINNNINNNINNIEILNVDRNNILFFINTNEDNFMIKNDKILLYNTKNIYKVNKDIYVINNNYTYPKICFYYKYFIIYFFSNQFLHIDEAIDFVKYKTNFNLLNNDSLKYNFNTNIIISNKTINIKTDYNFIVALYPLRYIDKKTYYIHIASITDYLRNYGLIYSPLVEFDKDLFYLFLITDSPLETEQYLRNILNNKFKIMNIITIISTKGKFNTKQLLNKYIKFC